MVEEIDNKVYYQQLKIKNEGNTKKPSASIFNEIDENEDRNDEMKTSSNEDLVCKNCSE
ncbi:unnamed protein product, partial [Allacma fusca]